MLFSNDWNVIFSTASTTSDTTSGQNRCTSSRSTSAILGFIHTAKFQTPIIVVADYYVGVLGRTLWMDPLAPVNVTRLTADFKFIQTGTFTDI